MGTDVRFVVDQFALCNRFASLGVTNPDNTLLPQAYGKVQTPFLKQNRKESFAVAYGDTNKTYTFPESLRVLQAAYLRVDLPVNASGDYKDLPGLHVIKTIHIRCNGDLVYSTPYRTLMLDHLASLRDSGLRCRSPRVCRWGSKWGRKGLLASDPPAEQLVVALRRTVPGSPTL